MGLYCGTRIIGPPAPCVPVFAGGRLRGGGGFAGACPAGGVTGVASSTLAGAADASAPFGGSCIGLIGGTAPAAFSAASAAANAASAACDFAAAASAAALAAASASCTEAVAAASDCSAARRAAVAAPAAWRAAASAAPFSPATDCAVAL